MKITDKEVTSRSPKAIIFDMDGVISDTQHIYSSVESSLLKEHGVDIHPDDISHRYSGMKSQEMFGHIFKDSEKTPQEIEDILQERYRRIVYAFEENIFAVPGTLEFLDKVKSSGLLTAVASASRLSIIEKILVTLNIREKFDTIASAQEVEKGKPEPDIFLLAAQRLGCDPATCIVVEDGIHGMVGAKKAGMKCVGLVRSGVHEHGKYPADTIVSNLKDLDLDQLYNLMQSS